MQRRRGGGAEAGAEGAEAGAEGAEAGAEGAEAGAEGAEAGAEAVQTLDGLTRAFASARAVSMMAARAASCRSRSSCTRFG